jgi:hypothetical protein
MSKVTAFTHNHEIGHGPLMQRELFRLLRPTMNDRREE